MSDKALFNPLSKDFSFEWLDDNNNPHVLVIKSQEIGRFPPHQYEFMRRHLADEILHIRELNPYKADTMKEIYKEIDL